jgi:hypothetical protein
VAEETWAMIGMVLTGLGIVVGGAAGLLLPRGRRAGAMWSLITGAGVGWIVFALGTVVKGYEASLFVFVLGGSLGLLTVCAGVWFVSTSSRWDD